jgi:hypothetical protein
MQQVHAATQEAGAAGPNHHQRGAHRHGGIEGVAALAQICSPPAGQWMCTATAPCPSLLCAAGDDGDDQQQSMQPRSASGRPLFLAQLGGNHGCRTPTHHRHRWRSRGSTSMR